MRNNLKEKGLPYTIVRLLDDKFTVLDKETYIPMTDEESNEVLEEVFSRPYAPHGSVRMYELLKDDEFNVFRNAITLNHNDLKLFFDGYLLNEPIAYGLLDDLYPPSERFFIKPLEDNKLINGQLITEGEFYALKKYRTDPKFDDTPLVIFEEKKIDREYRFFIIDGKVITGSRYMELGKVITSPQVPKEAWDFVEKMNDLSPLLHTCIDIAETDGTYYLLEINTIEASGLYELDVDKILLATTKLLFKENMVLLKDVNEVNKK